MLNKIVMPAKTTDLTSTYNSNNCLNNIIESNLKSCNNPIAYKEKPKAIFKDKLSIKKIQTNIKFQSSFSNVLSNTQNQLQKAFNYFNVF